MICVDINKTEDYPAICELWQRQGHPIIEADLLPSKGLKILDNNRLLCAGWLYQTDSKMCWGEWVVADPSCDIMTRRAAIGMLISGLTDLGKSLGFTVFYSTIRHKSLIKAVKNQGFIQTNEHCGVFFKKL
jgi:hypothetical protein